MPRTEAGKALLATVAAAVDGRDNDETMTVDVSWLWTLTHRIDAIEAEACHHDARWIEQFTAWCVKAERARIRAAVKKCIAHHSHEPGKNCVSAFCAAGLHAAVLRIIDETQP